MCKEDFKLEHFNEVVNWLWKLIEEFKPVIQMTGVLAVAFAFHIKHTWRQDQQLKCPDFYYEKTE